MIKGRAHKYGSNVDTDVIIPARYLNTTDPAELATHCLEDLDPAFISKVHPGDVIVGEDNFGCGSSREHAPICIKAAGVSCVIANSFARIFYRNSLNIGLPILECPDAVAGISAGDEIEIDLATGRIANLTTGKSYSAKPFPEFMRKLIELGGLVNYAKTKLTAGA
ncbi:MAG: 3-isopropylmalate dehydratase small subunit [Armatimonadota bacterium]|nr:3-isopropylmalate dehydratase small subunit [Armatimonadota bacterium]